MTIDQKIRTASDLKMFIRLNSKRDSFKIEAIQLAYENVNQKPAIHCGIDESYARKSHLISVNLFRKWQEKP
jgi:hypothetical protein